MIFILGIVAIFNQVYSQCVTNTTIGTNVYIPEGQQLILQLSDYFQGGGLFFKCNSSQFNIQEFYSIYATEATYTNQGKILDIELIASASQYLFNDPNVQTGEYALLISTPDSYQVYLGTMTTQYQLPMTLIGILPSSNLILCNQLAYLGKYQIIVSCIDLLDSTILFYTLSTTTLMDNQFTIFTKSNSTIDFGNDIGNIKFTELQIVQPTSAQQGNKLLIFLDYQVISPNNSVITYSTTFLASQSSDTQYYDINYTLLRYQAYVDSPLIGVYFTTDFKAFLLYPHTLVLMIANNNEIYFPANSSSQYDFVGFAVQEIQGIGNQITYLIALIAQQGLINIIYDPQAQTSIQQQPINVFSDVLWDVFNTTLPYQMFVNGQYVVYYNNLYLAVFSGYYTTFPQQFILLEQCNTQSCSIEFDARYNIITQFTLDSINQYQLQIPQLTNQNILATTQYISVEAESNLDNSNCSILFNITTITTDTQVYSTTNQAPSYDQLSFPTPLKQSLSPYFAGSNITYTVASSPSAEIVLNQCQLLYQQFTKIIFSSMIQSPYNLDEYIQFDQDNTYMLHIVYCYDMLCTSNQTNAYQLSAEIFSLNIGQYDNGVVYLGLIVSGRTNQQIVNIYQLVIDDSQLALNEVINLNVTQYCPTMTTTYILFLQDQLYVLTQVPAAVLVFTMPTFEFAFDISGQGLVPYTLHVNVAGYGNKLFIDNQYELLITQTIDNSNIILSRIPYANFSGTYTNGFGILDQGILIAIQMGRKGQILQYIFKEQILALNTNYTEIVPQQIITPNINKFSFQVEYSFTNTKFYVSATQPDDSAQVMVYQFNSGSVYEFLYYSIYVNSSIQYISSIERNGFDLINIFDSRYNYLVQLYHEASFTLYPGTYPTYNQTYSITVIATTNNSLPLAFSVQATFIDALYYLSVKPLDSLTQISMSSPNGLVLVFPEQHFEGNVQYYSAAANSTDSEIELGIISPITISESVISGNYESATSGFLYGTGQVYVYLANVSGIYYTTPINPQNYYKFNSNYDFESCPFIYYDELIQIPIAICTNTTDTYFVQINLIQQSSKLLSMYDFTNYTTSFPNLKSAEYNNGILLLYNTTSFSLNYILSENGTIFCMKQLNFGVQPNQISYSLIQLNQNGQLIDGVIVLFKYNLAQLLITNGESALTYNIDLYPQIDPLYQLISIQQYKPLQYYGNITLFIVQTDGPGYVYSMSNSRRLSQPSKILLIQVLELQSIASLECIAIYVQNGLVVAKFYNEIRQSFWIGLYGIENTYNKVAYFIGYREILNPIDQIYLTENGTLLYQSNQQLFQVYLINYIYVSLLQDPKYGDQMSVNFTLRAFNQLSQAVTDIETYTHFQKELPLQQAPKSKWWQAVFVLVAAIIIFAALSVLCYKSRQSDSELKEFRYSQYQDEYDGNAQI